MCAYAEEWQRVFMKELVASCAAIRKRWRHFISWSIAAQLEIVWIFVINELEDFKATGKSKANDITLKNNKNNLPFIWNSTKNCTNEEKELKNLSVECRRSNCYWCWLNYQLARLLWIFSFFLSIYFLFCFTPSAWLFMAKINL